MHKSSPSFMNTECRPLVLFATALGLGLLFLITGVESFGSPAQYRLNNNNKIASSADNRRIVTVVTAIADDNSGGSEDFKRWARQARFAEDGDTIVELPRPLGLVLNADAQGNVYVEKIAPKGNAARTGKVKEGDIVTMCSATFGDQMWSCRGVGLSRVLAAIRVRSGLVRLVFESPKKYQAKKMMTEKQIREREDAAAIAQAKKDALLQELDSDEQGWKSKKKFFGLF